MIGTEYIGNRIFYEYLKKIFFLSNFILFIYSIIIFMFIYNNALSKPFFADNFNDKNKWIFITDGVMGGISSGSLNFLNINNKIVAHMSGEVSTKNNGGFIQIRRDLQNINLAKLRNISLFAKGNNDEYFIHIRTNKTILPWQYYSIKFFVNDKYTKIILPISKFKKSNFLLPSKISPEDIKSIAVVAYGKNYSADIFIQSIGFNY